MTTAVPQNEEIFQNEKRKEWRGKESVLLTIKEEQIRGA